MGQELIHCNPEVLHAPGECYFCDKYGQDRQQARIASRTPFTPNEANGWSGDTAAPAGKKHSHMGTTWTPPVEPGRVVSLVDRIRAKRRR